MTIRPCFSGIGNEIKVCDIAGESMSKPARTIDLTISTGGLLRNPLLTSTICRHQTEPLGVRSCLSLLLRRYLSPTPQFFPTGFDVNVIREASVCDGRSVASIQMAVSHMKMRACPKICPWEARTAKDKPGLCLAANDSKSVLPTVLGGCRLTPMKASIPVGVGVKGQWLRVRKGVFIKSVPLHSTLLDFAFQGHLTENCTHTTLQWRI